MEVLTAANLLCEVVEEGLAVLNIMELEDTHEDLQSWSARAMLVWGLNLRCGLFPRPM